MTPKNMTWTRVSAVALGLVAGLGLGFGVFPDARCWADGASKKDKEKTANKKPAKPKIDEVKPAQKLPGGNVVLVGSGFSIFMPEVDLMTDMKAYREAIAAVSATVGGEKAAVLELSDSELTITVPLGLKKGPAKIELTIDDRSASASVTILDEGSRKDQRDEDQKRESGETLPSADFLSLDLPQSSIDRGKTVIGFTGKAEGLPDGAVIKLKLTLGSEDVDNTTAEVKGNGYGGRFGAYEKALYAGQYWVEARFELGTQTVGFRKKFAEAFKSDPKVAAQHARAGARQPVQVGTSEQADAQAKELKDNVSSAVTRARELLAEIAVGYGSAGRSGFTSGGGKVDEAAWEAWLEKHAYKAFPPGDRPKRLKEMQVKRDFLAGNGTFADGRWREFIDGKREEIVLRLKEHDAYRSRFLVVRDLEGLQKLGSIWIQLQDIAINWSRELYENAKVPPDPKDPAISARNAGQVLVDLVTIENRLVNEQPKK